MSRWNLPTALRDISSALPVVAVLVLTAVVVIPQRGMAQAPELKCGADTDESFSAAMLEHFAPIFTDSEYADFRASRGIVTVPEGAPRQVIRDARVCQRLLPAVRKALRTAYHEPVHLKDWDLTFFRFGDYYAVSASPQLSPERDVNGYSPLFIFRAETLEYLGLING